MHGNRSNGKGASKDRRTNGGERCSDMNNCAISPEQPTSQSQSQKQRKAREAEVEVEPAARGSVGLYV